MRTWRRSATLATGILVAAGGLVTVGPALAAAVSPSFVAGNPSCADLGLGSLEVKFDPPTSGTMDLGPLDTVTMTTADGIYLDWSATLGIDAVIVKGGPNANVYAYSPEATADTGLSSPINPSNGTPYAISHVSFCYDFELDVAKTANTSLERTWTWDIDKVGDQTALTLQTGQTHLVNYDVTLTAVPADSDWTVSGSVTIANPAPVAATITAIADTLAGVPVALTCGVSLPYSLPSGQTLTCSYEVAVADATTRTNAVTVTTSGAVGGGSAEATADFATATINEVDECTTVTDDRAGALGEVCYTDLPVTIEYSLHVGPYPECGEYTFTNTATFTTNDLGATGSDDHTVTVTVPCDGCTLTQGYWKTHSEYGPAPADSGWDVVGGPDAAFYGSGQTWYQVFWTAPAGNAYYVLAQQYMAAKLNILNGTASNADVAAAITGADAFFSANNPGTKLSKTDRAAVLAWAATLDAYNNGLIGPGHCSE